MTSAAQKLFRTASTPVCGVDPGIRTTGTVAISTFGNMIQRIHQVCEGKTNQIRPGEYATWNLRASHVNHVTHSDQHRLRRERMKKAGKENTEAENRRIERDRRAREIRNLKTYQRLADTERALFSGTRSSQSAVHFYGQWQPKNCMIKGHARRGTKRLRVQQRRQSLVVMVDEFNTSKTCHWCLKPLRLQKYRTVDGRIRRRNGAVQCVNPQCISLAEGCSTMNRDGNASKNIALKGTSMVVSIDGTPLAPFNSKHTSTYELDQSLPFNQPRFEVSMARTGTY